MTTPTTPVEEAIEALERLITIADAYVMSGDQFSRSVKKRFHQPDVDFARAALTRLQSERTVS